MTYELNLRQAKLASFLESDSVAVAQYLETFRRRVVLHPERRLVLAILEDALRCIQKYSQARDKKGKRLFRQAEEWIMAEESTWTFSFVNVCEMLALDPGYVRLRVMRLTSTESRLEQKIPTRIHNEEVKVEQTRCGTLSSRIKGRLKKF